MSTQVALPEKLRGLTCVELEARFALQRGDVEAVTTTDRSISATVRDGVTLPIATQAEMDGSIFGTITAAQAEAWVENNVSTLATAKTALKHLARFCVYLRDRG